MGHTNIPKTYRQVCKMSKFRNLLYNPMPKVHYAVHLKIGKRVDLMFCS